jgi:hypothetical protein
LTTKEILYELWIPSVPLWIASPQNIEHLGKAHLPALSKSTKYDILILDNWDVPLNKTETEKLFEYFTEGCAIVATFQSAYGLYNVSPQIVRDIFGIEKVYPPNVNYSNLTYYTQHYITSNFSIPFNSTGVEHGVPVSNLTAAQGIVTATSFEELYLLTVNENENGTRAAHFGIEVSGMSEIDVIIFKRLLLWISYLEAARK